MHKLKRTHVYVQRVFENELHDRGRPSKPWLLGPCDPRYIKKGGAGARLTRLIAATIPSYNPYRFRVSAVLTGSSTTVTYSLPSPCALASLWPPARVHPLLDKVGSPDLLAYSDPKSINGMIHVQVAQIEKRSLCHD